ncbi:MAG: hypothetical protein ABIB71_01775 [Candidatus Woesearchaeota archaeon]
MPSFVGLASKIVDKGLENTDLSMLPWDKKMVLLTDVAILLHKRGNYDDAVKAIIMSGNVIRMRLWVDEFLKTNKVKQATLCAIALKDKEKLERLGMMCMKEGYYRVAADAFKKVGKNDLAEFVKMNFLF